MVMDVENREEQSKAEVFGEVGCFETEKTLTMGVVEEQWGTALALASEEPGSEAGLGWNGFESGLEK